MRHISFLLLTFILAFSTLSFSAQVTRVKGKAILIDTTGDDIQMGKTYYLISNGKKKGIIKVMKLRPGQALAKLLKGKALSGWTLRDRTAPNLVAKESAPEPTLQPVRRRNKKKRTSYSKNKGKLSIGLAFGYNSNSSDVKFVGNTPRSDSYTGTSSSYELLADYQLHKKFYLRGSLGMQNFNTEDSTNTLCGNGGNEVCRVDLGYLNFDIWLRYYLNEGKYRFWGGAGLGILLSPSYNSTTALNEKDLATTTIMQAGAGADLSISDKLYVPLWAEYGIYPSSDTVSMSAVSFYLGLAYRL
ncbi:MAG: outer membrane beta-barrel protein [Bdellovibrionales bacterium]